MNKLIWLITFHDGETVRRHELEAEYCEVSQEVLMFKNYNKGLTTTVRHYVLARVIHWEQKNEI